MSTLQEKLDRIQVLGGEVSARSINRLLDHVNDKKATMFAMLTASHSIPKGLSEQEGGALVNKYARDNSNMVRMFVNKGIGPMKLVGSWKDEDTSERYIEPSFLLPYYPEKTKLTPKMFVALVGREARKYKQYAYVIGDLKAVGVVHLLPTKRFEKFQSRDLKLVKSDLENLWTQVKGYENRGFAFKFAGVLKPNSFMGALVFEQTGLVY